MRMGKRTIFMAMAVAALAWSVSAQEWRGGRGRLEGTVKDPGGQPIAGAKVSLRWEGGTEGPDLTTNKKGRWAILGLTGGNWDVDITAPGYQPKQTSIRVSEVTRNPNLDVELQPEVKKEAPREVITVGGKEVSKEVADAIDKGNAAMGAKNYSEAKAEYLKALPSLPDNMSILTNLELSSYFAKDYDDALKFARQIVEKDPESYTSWLMIAELELQKGNFDEGKVALAKVPDDKITDPQPYMNMAILYYNKGKAPEAEDYFTRALAKDPNQPDAYFYRGLARYQEKHMADAKADLHKYLDLAPDGSEAQTAKDLLKTMK
jgi:cytochrome c-type biogenesis protein CcmH/NrfG